MTPTAACRECGEHFRTRRRAIYCSGRCKQAAYRRRCDIRDNIPASARKRRGVGKRRLRPLSAAVSEPQKAVTSAFEVRSATPLPGAVTQAKILQLKQRPAKAKNESVGAVEHRIGPGEYPVNILGGYRWPDAPKLGNIIKTVLWKEVAPLTDLAACDLPEAA